MKKFIALLLVMVMCVGAGIGGTLAYLTDRDSEVNVFTVGDVKIALEGKFSEGTQLIPGVKIENNATIKNTGANAAWVWYTYAVPTKLAEAIEIELDGTDFTKKTSVTEKNVPDGYTTIAYLYDDALAVGAQISGPKSITLSTAVDIDPEGNWYKVVDGNATTLNWNTKTDGAPKVYVAAYAIQQDQFDNVNDAFDAYTTQWKGLNAEYEAVETTYVNTASELAAALAEGGNVTLVKAIETSESIVIPEGKTVALDLNGKKITGTVGRDADSNRIHTLVNNGTLTIKNGTVASAGVNGGSAIYNADGATLTVENVTLNGAPQEGSTWPSYTVNNYGTLTVSDSSIYGVQGIIATNNTANTTVNNVIAYRDGWSSGHVFYTSSTAKVTINGGTYTNDGNGVDGTMIYGGETVVNGGTFIVQEGAYFALCSGSKLTVNGGDFSNIKSCLAWGGAMTISGGTFGFNPTTYVADGYVTTDNGDGTYTVSATKVSTGAELSSAINSGKAVELTGDVKYSTAIDNDANINLNGNTFEATYSYDLKNNADLTMKNGDYVVNSTYGHIDVRPTTAEGSVVTFENVDFTSNYKSTSAVCTDRLRSVVETAPVAGANVELIFKNCTFDNAKVYIEGMSGGAGTFKATFENCTFNALTSSAPIEVKNYMKGTITVKNCTFNLECTSSSASAIAVSPSSSTEVTIVAENNTINAVAATPYTYDASKGETEVDTIKVNGTPANIKFISAYSNTTVNETNTIKTGIAQ